VPVDDDLPISPRWVLGKGELQWRFSRSSGPGGQGVNTADSRVELTVDIARSPSLPDWLRDRVVRRLDGRLRDGVLSIVASEERSQLRNREAARARLQALLADAIAPPSPVRRATRPSRGAVERRLTSKKVRSETKRLRSRPVD